MRKELTNFTQGSALGFAALPMLQRAGIVLGGSLLVAVCAHISLPLYFTPVPLTLQNFAVLLIGLFLSPRLAAELLTVYLLEGAAGLPVFSPTPAIPGVAHLLGPTGGYLLAYPIAAALISILWRRSSRTFTAALATVAAGDLLILSCGVAVLAFYAHASLNSVLAAGFIPFLPGEALKVAAAAACAAGFKRFRRAG